MTVNERDLRVRSQPRSAASRRALRVAHLAKRGAVRLGDEGTFRLAAPRRSLGSVAAAVALTFDDGPDPRFTPLILDALARLEVKATFFVVGKRATSSPQLVERMMEEGHAIGTHSSSHPDAKQLGLRALERDFRAGRERVEDIVGAPVRLFRPPYGHIDFMVAAAMRANRLEPWLWTVAPGDWLPGITPDGLAAATSAVSAGDVVLLHDGIWNPLDVRCTDRSPTLAAVSRIVAQVRSRGLEFVTLCTKPRPGTEAQSAIQLT